MEFTFFQLLFFGIIVALANVLGGLVLFPTGFYKNYKKFLKYLLALGAGFMLAVTFIEILPGFYKNYKKKRLRFGRQIRIFLLQARIYICL